MKFNLKTYKLLKFKTYIKKKNFLILTIAVARKNQIKQDQKFKKLNYNYHQIYNTLSKKILKGSIYKNYIFLIKGLITLLDIKDNNGITNLEQLNKHVTIIGFKVNNRIYFVHQLKSKNLQFSYKHNYMNITQTLKTVLTSFKFQLSK